MKLDHVPNLFVVILNLALVVWSLFCVTGQIALTILSIVLIWPFLTNNFVNGQPGRWFAWRPVQVNGEFLACWPEYRWLCRVKVAGFTRYGILYKTLDCEEMFKYRM